MRCAHVAICLVMLTVACGQTRTASPGPRSERAASGTTPARAPEEPSFAEEPPPPNTGDRVLVSTEPPGVEVLNADGLLIGNTPYALRREDLPLSLSLQTPGFRARTVELQASSPDSVHVSLEPDRPLARPTRVPSSMPARPRSRAFAGVRPVFDCPAEEVHRCEVLPGVVGMTAEEIEGHLGSPARSEGERRTYHYAGYVCGFPVLGLELRMRNGRVAAARLFHNTPGVIDCAGP